MHSAFYDIIFSLKYHINIARFYPTINVSYNFINWILIFFTQFTLFNIIFTLNSIYSYRLYTVYAFNKRHICVCYVYPVYINLKPSWHWH